MSKDNYDYSDLDAILAEFRGESPAEAPNEPVDVQSGAREEGTDSPFTFEAEPEAKRVSVYTASEEPARPDGVSEAATIRFDPPERRASDELPHRRARLRRAELEAPAPQDEPAEEAEEEAAPEEAPTKKPRRLGRRARAEKKPKEEKPPREYKKVRIPWILRALMALAFLALSLAVVAWTGLNIHPASGTPSAAAAGTKLRLSDKLDTYVNNAAADALGDLTFIRKIYTLQESATVAPAPDPACFGSSYDPNDVLEVIKKAAVLLDGQEVTFYAGANFASDEPIRWYLDDTILVIAWKEIVEGRYCNFAEVKIAHPSQFRRKLADDSFGSSVQLYASELAKSANAVVASNADFYGFREIGLTVYQRELYRFNPDRLDICFITSSGDMLFSRAGELTSAEEAQRFVEENDVLFSLAFGPVLVDNGELQYCASYPIGEIGNEYTRSCLAMTGPLHYLLMTISWSPDGLSPHATVNDLSRTIYSKNVLKAYALDGGQTAEIVMGGEPFSRIDWNAERPVSDIIYFATAIPEEVRP